MVQANFIKLTARACISIFFHIGQETQTEFNLKLYIGGGTDFVL